MGIARSRKELRRGIKIGYGEGMQIIRLMKEV